MQCFDYASVKFDVDYLETKRAVDGMKLGTFTGLAAAYGSVDRQNDIIDPGAFKSATDPSKIKLFWQHDRTQPIGVYRSVKETSTGLEVEGELNLEVEKAREAYALLKQGAIDSLSVGFKINPNGSRVEKIRQEGGSPKRIRRIKSATLFEVSLVTLAANDAATIQSVKQFDGRLPSVTEFEAYLREAAGFSRREAKCVVARGYDHLLNEKGISSPSVGTVNNLLRQALKDLG